MKKEHVIHYSKYAMLFITLGVMVFSGYKGYVLLQVQAEENKEDIVEQKVIQSQQTENIDKVLAIVMAQATQIAVQETISKNVGDKIVSIEKNMETMKEDIKELLKK